MKNYILDTEDSIKLKGVAIIMMFLHHLYAFPVRIFNVTYIKIIPQISLEYHIGIFSKLCVPIFLFLSGYGLEITSKHGIHFSKVLKKIKELYCIYWIVFIIFIPLKFKITDYKFDKKEFVYNFLGISSSYNGEWWFFRIYILFIIFYYFGKKFSFFSSKYLFLKSFTILLTIYILKFFIRINFFEISETIYPIYQNIEYLCINQIPFIVGILFVKENLFEKIELNFKKLGKNKNKSKIVILLFLIYLRGNFKIISFFDFLITPIFITIIVNFLNLNKIKEITLIIGKNSTIMWLSHSFLCYQLFQNLIFFPKYSILILIWLLSLSLIISIVILKIKFFLVNKLKLIKMKDVKI